MSSTIVQAHAATRAVASTRSLTVGDEERALLLEARLQLLDAQRHGLAVGVPHQQRHRPAVVDPGNLQEGAAAVARDQLDPVAAPHLRDRLFGPERAALRAGGQVGEVERLEDLQQSTLGALFVRSEEHTLNSSHVKISYAVFCLKKKK